MKKLYALSLLLTGTLAFGQFTEPFSGTGALNANGWTNHSGTAGQVQILSTASDSGNSLSFAGLAASSGNRVAIVSGNSEDLNKASSAPITTTAYFSALIKVQNTTGMAVNSHASGDYFLAATSTVGAAPTAFQGRIYVKQGVAENTVNLGVLNNSGGTAAPSFLTADFPINTTIFVVVKYDIASNTASIWANPTPGSSESAAGATNATGTTAAPASVLGVAIRQGSLASSAGTTGNIEIDEIRLGSTWASVTPANLSVKENNIAGLKVYPNPVTNGKLFITTDANVEKTVAIYDVLGKQVVNTTATEFVNVSNLKGGVYIVKITEEGKTATRKLVIK